MIHNYILSWGLLFFQNKKIRKMKNFVKNNNLKITSIYDKPSKLFNTRFSISIGKVVYLSYKSTNSDRYDGLKWIDKALGKAEEIQEQLYQKIYDSKFKLVKGFISVLFINLKSFLRFNKTDVL